MKNKIKKIILLLVSVIMVFSICTTQVQATIGDPMTNPDSWAPDAMSGTGTHYKPIIKNILGIINTIGVIVSVVVLMVIGIKYMMGSAEQKAEYKKTMLGYVIGAIMLFSLTTIPNILYTIGTSI